MFTVTAPRYAAGPVKSTGRAKSTGPAKSLGAARSLDAVRDGGAAAWAGAGLRVVAPARARANRPVFCGWRSCAAADDEGRLSLGCRHAVVELGDGCR